MLAVCHTSMKIVTETHQRWKPLRRIPQPEPFHLYVSYQLDNSLSIAVLSLVFIQHSVQQPQKRIEFGCRRPQHQCEHCVTGTVYVMCDNHCALAGTLFSTVIYSQFGSLRKTVCAFVGVDCVGVLFELR